MSVRHSKSVFLLIESSVIDRESFSCIIYKYKLTNSLPIITVNTLVYRNT